MWDALEAKYGKAGGASTYLQLVNMVKNQFTDLMDLLPQIQEFQENYTWILSNGYSKLSEDLATFIFCSCLPKSYQDTTQKYLNNIMSIANYKIQDAIDHVIQEESRRKAYSIPTRSSPDRLSTVKNLYQKCTKCGMTDYSTQQHWPGGKHPNKGKGKGTPKSVWIVRGQIEVQQKGQGHGEGQRKGQEWPKCIINCRSTGYVNI